MSDRVGRSERSNQASEAVFLIFSGGQDHEFWAGEFCGAFATREAAEATLRRGYGGRVFEWVLGPDGRYRGEGQS